MRTEEISPRFADLDAWTSLDAVHAMFEGQLTAVAAVGAALPQIVAAGEAAAAHADGGRLVYAGAGTSGRIGVQDGAELSPTFDWPEERVVFAIAGGDRAPPRAPKARRTMAKRRKARWRISRSARPTSSSEWRPAERRPTRSNSSAAHATAARWQSASQTIRILRSSSSAEHPILIDTGPEVLAGSTRMKAGTAQKVVLNLF